MRDSLVNQNEHPFKTVPFDFLTQFDFNSCAGMLSECFTSLMQRSFEPLFTGSFSLVFGGQFILFFSKLFGRHFQLCGDFTFSISCMYNIIKEVYNKGFQSSLRTHRKGLVNSNSTLVVVALCETNTNLGDHMISSTKLIFLAKRSKCRLTTC